jgi:2-methylcitrate synthase
MRQLAAKVGDTKYVGIYDAIKNVIEGRKKIYCNVDYPCGLTYHLLGLPIDVYTPLFVCSRISGWAAHVIEQHFDNRIIRPLSEYTGPPKRAWTPVEKR